jgi:hypothetical protein
LGGFVLLGGVGLLSGSVIGPLIFGCLATACSPVLAFSEDGFEDEVAALGDGGTGGLGEAATVGSGGIAPGD